MNAKAIAHSIVSEAKAEGDARRNKISEIAKQLNVTFEQASSLVRQEEARKLAGEKYRQSDAYKRRLEQQKIVRQLLKGSN